MSHNENHSVEEKKSVNFWGPVIGGLVIWLIVVIIETSLDEKSTDASHQVQTEQTETSHH